MTLYRETPCEHDEPRLHRTIRLLHRDGVPSEIVEVVTVSGLCLGGIREEVTVDMEAGAKKYIEKWNELAPFANTQECFKAGFDAALHTEKEPASTVRVQP